MQRRQLSRRHIVALPALTLIVALSACSADTTTIPASAVAEVSADALESQLGVRPSVDCGEDRVDLADDVVVNCAVTDPGTNAVYDAAVTLGGVEGTDYHVSVVVADDPR